MFLTKRDLLCCFDCSRAELPIWWIKHLNYTTAKDRTTTSMASRMQTSTKQFYIFCYFVLNPIKRILISKHAVHCTFIVWDHIRILSETQNRISCLMEMFIYSKPLSYRQKVTKLLAKIWQFYICHKKHNLLLHATLSTTNCELFVFI